MHRGYNLKQVRQKFGYSQMKIAEVLETTQPQYNKYETGKQDPGARVILKLSRFYGVSADELLNREE